MNFGMMHLSQAHCHVGAWTELKWTFLLKAPEVLLSRIIARFEFHRFFFTFESSLCEAQTVITCRTDSFTVRNKELSFVILIAGVNLNLCPIFTISCTLHTEKCFITNFLPVVEFMPVQTKSSWIRSSRVGCSLTILIVKVVRYCILLGLGIDTKIGTRIWHSTTSRNRMTRISLVTNEVSFAIAIFITFTLAFT